MARKTALSILLVLAACGGGGGDGSPRSNTTGPATVADYCNQYWTELATRWAACTHGSAAYFGAIYSPSLLCGDMVKAVAGGRATYQAARAGACLDHVETASCPALEALVAGESPQADCLAAVAGHAAEYGACYSNEGCASDLCLTSTFQCPGTCASGTACPFCARGLICDMFTLTCKPPKAQGSSCMEHSECQHALYCQPSGGLEPGSCQPRKTEGSCTSDAVCAIGYACDSASDTCVRLLASGESCTQGDNACGPGLWCGPGTNGTCIDGPAPHQSCASVNGETLTCIGGWCNFMAGACAAWLAEGAECTAPQGQCEPTAWCDVWETPYVCTAPCAEP